MNSQNHRRALNKNLFGTVISLQSESSIQKQIKDYLRMRKWFVFKINNSGVFDKHLNKFRTIETKGISDLIAVKNGVVLFLEIKSETGRQSDHQKTFEENIKLHNGNYFLVRSLDDMITIEKSL